MNRLIVIIVVVLLLLGGAFFYFNVAGKKTLKPSEMLQQGSGQNVFTSIKDALSKSVSLECKYKDEKGREYKTDIKAGAVRVTVKSEPESKEPNNFLMKGTKMYMWNENTKKGFVYAWQLPEGTTPGATKPSVAATGQTNQSQSILAQIEKFKDACHPAVLPDSLFTQPSDVEFQDMETIQKQFMQKANPVDNAASGYSQEDIQKMIKQYAPTETP